MQRVFLAAAAAVAVAAGACGDDAGSTEVDAPPGGGDAPAGCPVVAPAQHVVPTWQTHPPLPLGPTQETAVVAVGEHVYVLGGFEQNRGIVNKVQVYDTTTCTWSMGPDLPKEVHHINAAVVGETIYIVGAMQTPLFTSIGDVWAWNPATDAGWQTRTPMPAGTQRGAGVAGAIDGKIYVAGGLRGGAVAELSAYDPAADAWDTQLPALPATRDHGCGGVIGGKLYVAGGRQADIGTPRATLYEYTPGGAWVERAPMPTARGGTACGIVGTRLVVVGGEGNAAAPSGVFPQAEAYDAATDTWEELSPMPVPRHGMGAAAVGGRIYVPGGATVQAFGAVDTHEVLTP